MPPADEPMIQTIAASVVRQQFSQILNDVFRREIRVVIEKSGIPVAALVSADDLERLRRYELAQKEEFAVLDRMRTALQDVPALDVEREVARAIAQVRAEKQQKGPFTTTTP